MKTTGVPAMAPRVGPVTSGRSSSCTRPEPLAADPTLTPGIMIPAPSAALRSEQLLFGVQDDAPRDKVLLAAPVAAHVSAAADGLRAIATDQDWALYAAERTLIEAAYGVAPEQVARLVAHMRDVQSRHPMTWFLYQPGDEPSEPSEPVGAVGLYEFVHDGRLHIRLQDVDVFPRFRAQGHGNRLLGAVHALARRRGATTVLVGADVDDWPLQWYLRKGFVPVASVPKAKRAALSAGNDA
jgi:GNAT superfamily N-acetyltransferase